MPNTKTPTTFLLFTLILTSVCFLSSCGGSDNKSNSGTPMIEIANPSISAVVTEPTNKPFYAGTSFDLGSFSYQVDEYFIAGSANSFVNSNVFDSDGRWDISVAEQAEYKTRLVVHRPIKASDFNGTVVVEWMNVSGGLDAGPDWIMAHTELIRRGYAWVGVSAQIVGIEGVEGSLVNLSLKAVNSERYGSLSHPGDSFSYDIFSQAAQSVRHPQGLEPLQGLEIKQMIAVGESQSASRMTTYVNAVAPHIQLFDAYLIHSRLGSSAPLSQEPQTLIQSPDIVRIREDLQQPIIMLQTETDLLLLGSLASRQTDSENFRLWEVAGTAHADTYTVLGISDAGSDPAIAEVREITAPVPGIIDCDEPINSGPQHFVVKAAVAALQRWINEGIAASSAARIEVNGEPPVLQRDEYGNVRGGIRTPYVDVPVAMLSGEGGSDGFCTLFGRTILFDSASLQALYENHESYVRAVHVSTDQAVADGFILESDGNLIKTAAENSDIGN